MHVATATLRPALPADFSALQHLFRHTHQYHVGLHPEQFRAFSGAVKTEQELQELVESPEKALLVAEAGDDLVGFVILLSQPKPDWAGRVEKTFVLVDLIGVHPDFQHLGIGQQLMEKAREWALARNIRFLQLNVYDRNEQAARFYRQQGFEPVMHRLELSL